jgi:DNA-binding response OmpR family regulator
MDHIVVYEEDELMRALLKEWLSEAGYRVSALASREGPPGPGADLASADLIIVSLYMPKHIGAQMIRKVRGMHPGVPVIAISGQFRSDLCDVGATARALGVEQVMAKPLSRTNLLDSIRAMICSPARPGC